MLRLIRIQPEITLLSQPSPYYIVGKRFRQAVAGDHNFPEDCDKMAQAHSPNTDSREETLSSLGNEYATRCVEEGFGGIYGKYVDKSSKEDDEENHGGANSNASTTHEGGKEGIGVKYKEEDGNQKKHAN